jgi:uncharacterized Tic20 family protein
MSLPDELAKLQELRSTGAISEDEFQRAKAQLLNGGRQPPPYPGAGPIDAQTIENETRFWAMLIHVSQYAGYVVLLAGFVVPIVLWQIKKNELPGVDAHGKIVTNWMISAIIYGAIGAVLSFVFIGIPLLFVLGLLCLIFPIVGAIKANDGQAWQYPLSIRFF